MRSWPVDGRHDVVGRRKASSQLPTPKGLRPNASVRQPTGFLEGVTGSEEELEDKRE